MYRKGNNELMVVALYTSDYKRELYLREIARLARLPVKTTQNTLMYLEKSGILKSKVHGKNKYFSLNHEHIQTKLALTQAELYKTARFVETHPSFALFMKENTSPAPLILFGSVAKGTAQKHSDADLLVIAEHKQQLPLYLLPFKVHLIMLTEEAFHASLEKGEALLSEIDQNHVVLNNHSWYVHMLWSFHGQ